MANRVSSTDDDVDGVGKDLADRGLALRLAVLMWGLWLPLVGANAEVNE